MLQSLTPRVVFAGLALLAFVSMAFAMGYLERHRRHGEIVTGVLYIDQNVPDMHEQSRSTDAPLRDLPFEDLSPGRDALMALQKTMK